MHHKLTHKIIDEFKLPDDVKRKKLTDGGGLYLLVTTKGKYWRYNYRFEGKGKTLALGVYPEITLKQARHQHRHALKLINQGEDPAMVRAAHKKTVKQLNNLQQALAKRLGQRSIKRSDVALLMELEHLGISFYFNNPNVPDTNGFPMTFFDVIKFLEDPVLFIAEKHGVDRMRYLAWRNADHNVQCAAITKKCTRCKHIIKHGVDAKTFAQMWGARCTQH